MSESGARLLFYNYIDSDILANSDVSSEQASFPIENAYSKTRRSKVWRSGGYFKVESTNNTIIFRETALTDLTATITVGEYTSISSMCTAIKTALEAVGDSTYTVTNSNSTGYKFNIVSNGVGGGGVFHLMLASVSFTAEDLLGFSNASSLTDSSLTRTGDFLTINSEEFILWDMGLSTNPKCFALIGPRNTPLKLSPSCTLTLQASHNDAWDMPAFEQVLTYNDRNIFYLDEAGIGDDSYRYWRLKIEDQSPFGFVEVGAFFLGNYFNPIRGRVQFPLQVSLLDPSETMYSEGGQTFSDIKDTTSTYKLTWFALQKADIEEFEDWYQDYGRNKPFFIALDSTEIFSTSANRRVLFCKIIDDPDWSLIAPDVYDLTMFVREEL